LHEKSGRGENALLHGHASLHISFQLVSRRKTLSHELLMVSEIPG